MNFEGFVNKHLVDNGLSEKQSVIITNIVKKLPENEQMCDRWWENYIADLPDVMKAIIPISVNAAVLDYIDAKSA